MLVIPNKKHPLHIDCSHCHKENIIWIVNSCGRFRSFRWSRRSCRHCGKRMALKLYDHLRKACYIQQKGVPKKQ